MVINSKQHNTKYRLIKFLGLLSALMLISSCAVYKTGFECPAGKGQGCKSVTEVNEMVSRGEIGRNIAVWSREVAAKETDSLAYQGKQKNYQLKPKQNRDSKTVTKKTKNANTETKNISPKTVSNTKTQDKSEDKAVVSNNKIKKACGC